MSVIARFRTGQRAENIDRLKLQMKYSPYSDWLAFKQFFLGKSLNRNFSGEENSTNVGLIG